MGVKWIIIDIITMIWIKITDLQVATDVSTEVALIGLVTVFIYAITSIIY